MSNTHYLAIDVGAESGRAILGHLDGSRLEMRELHRFPNLPVRLPIAASSPGGESTHLHWDVLRLWSEIKEALRLAAHAQDGAPASLGIDTWGVDFALLDRQGGLVGNPYHYRDGRTDGMLAEAFRRMPREQIFEHTGIQFMQINTLYQLLAMVVGRSPALDIADTFLTVPDLLNYWLTGQKVCEFTNATTTQCYDPRQHGWSESVVVAMGVPLRLFPTVVAPGTVLGKLRPAVAEETGVGPIPVVAPACHDTGSAVAAVPAEGERFAWISSGTWSIMGVEVREPVITPQSLRFNLTNEGGVDKTFRCSKNIMGLWLVQECRRSWAGQGQEWSYGELSEMAAQAPPLVSVIDPDHGDFLKPGDMPARIRAYCRRMGQPVPESPGAVVRCALESVALKYRWVLERLEAVTGQRLEPIHIIGGGTQNRLLNQFTADAAGRTVVAGPVEATAVGNLLVQAVALGRIGSQAEARRVVSRSFSPDHYSPAASGDWDGAYQRLLTCLAQTSWDQDPSDGA